MTGYRWLSRIDELEQRIMRKEQKRDALRRCLFPASMDYEKDRVQTSPDDQMARIMAEVVDLDMEIERMKRRKYFLIQETEEMIERLEDEREKTVLSMYFIGQVPMTEIAGRIHYSLRQTYRFRDEGARHISEKLIDESE